MSSRIRTYESSTSLKDTRNTYLGVDRYVNRTFVYIGKDICGYDARTNVDIGKDKSVDIGKDMNWARMGVGGTYK